MTERTTMDLALSRAADAMFMQAAPDEAPLAYDCPEAHRALVRQARAAMGAFLASFPEDATVGDIVAEMEASDG